MVRNTKLVEKIKLKTARYIVALTKVFVLINNTSTNCKQLSTINKLWSQQHRREKYFFEKIDVMSPFSCQIRMMRNINLLPESSESYLFSTGEELTTCAMAYSVEGSLYFQEHLVGDGNDQYETGVRTLPRSSQFPKR